jgi:transposase
MARPLLPDELWAKVEPLRPPPKPRRVIYPGRRPLDRRRVRTGIRFVLRTGIRWNGRPAELGCGSGSRCRRYLRAWYRAGVWRRPHALLLAELREADQIDWSRAAVGSAHVRAPGGGAETGPSPVDRGRLGSKHPAAVEPHGIPPAAAATAANTPDVTALPRVVAAAPPVRGRRGRPRRRPKRRYGDRGYDSDPHRAAMRRRGIEPHFGRRRAPPGRGLGVFRWPVERFCAWLHAFRRLRLRTGGDARMHDAFLKLATRVICFNFL